MTSSSLRRRAFTLIELLIVITIIGILAVALIPRLTGGPARARDAQRQSDLQQIATALEFLANDKGGYPYFAGCIGSGTGTLGGDLSAYLTTLPSDPNTTSTSGTTGEVSSGACGTGYGYVGLKTSGTVATSYTGVSYSASGYLLFADLETETTRASGIYDVTTPSFTVANGTTNGTASYNLGTGNSSRVCSTSSCTGTNVIYVLGR